MNHEATAMRTISLSIAGSMLLVLVKGSAGILGHSFALTADAIESAADIVTSVLLLLALQYARRPADENHPYGHGRIEPLATFVVVVFLWVSAILIAWQSIRNIRTPHEMPESWTLWILAAIIAWKEISFRLVMRKSRQTNSSSLRAEAWHHRSDAITSLAAFAGISVALLGGRGYEAADDWAALCAAALIMYNSYAIFRTALSEIMDEHIYEDLIEEVRTLATDVDGVSATEKCFIRKSGMKYHVDLHVSVNPDLNVVEGHAIAHRLKDHLRSHLPQLGHVLIHIEPDTWPEAVL